MRFSKIAVLLRNSIIKKSFLQVIFRHFTNRVVVSNKYLCKHQNEYSASKKIDEEIKLIGSN